MNKKTKALDREQYDKIITTIRSGFTYGDCEFKPNNRLATILVVQANLGCRIGDILKLTLSDIIESNGKHRLDIVEQKTKKKRTFPIPEELYDFLKKYAEDNCISQLARLFPVCERAVQKQLKIVSEYLGYDNVSTHSFRKFYATSMYIIGDCDIVMVQKLLQHSSPAVTQAYIGVSDKKIEDAIQKHICLA